MISWVERGLLTSVGSQGERNAAVVGRGIRTGLLEMETAIKNRPFCLGNLFVPNGASEAKGFPKGKPERSDHLSKRID